MSTYMLNRYKGVYEPGNRTVTCVAEDIEKAAALFHLTDPDTLFPGIVQLLDTNVAVGMPAVNVTYTTTVMPEDAANVGLCKAFPAPYPETQIAESGSIVTLYAYNPENSGYTFENWTDTAGTVLGTEPFLEYTLPVSSGVITLTANFV